MKLVRITIPVKPAVKHFLIYNHSNQLNLFPQVKLDEMSSTGKFFLNLLASKKTRRDNDYSGYSDSIDIYISADSAERYGVIFSKTSIITFNNYIQEQLYTLMFLQCELLQEHSSNFSIKNAIEMFAARYDMDSNILEYETAKKAYYRYRLKIGGIIRKKIRTISPLHNG